MLQRATGQIDVSFGRRLPAMVEGLGLREVEHDEATLIGQGGDPSARSCRMTYQIQRGRHIAEGAFTARDFDELDRAFADPSFWFIPFTAMGCITRNDAVITVARITMAFVALYYLILGISLFAGVRVYGN